MQAEDWCPGLFSTQKSKFLIAISAMKKQIFTFEILYFILNIYIDPLLSVMENKPYKQVEDALGET